MYHSKYITCDVSIKLLNHKTLAFFQMATENNLIERLMSSLFVIINILCMFLANNIGQEITDHNNHVFATV